MTFSDISLARRMAQSRESNWQEKEDKSHWMTLKPFNSSFGRDAFREQDEELSSLLFKEKQTRELTLDRGMSPSESRFEAVEWILKITSHYSFSALTALLAVDYFDRFMLRFHFNEQKSWMTQLVSVACLSLAAKVEETRAPPLLDLQVENSEYVFESKTIQRMELLILSTLQWRMNPITPFSFLDYIVRKLGLRDFLRWELLKICEVTLLAVVSDSRFVLHSPSVMAAATMSHVVHNLAPSLSDFKLHLISILDIDKDEVDECLKLLTESAPTRPNKRNPCPTPGSPKDVMEFLSSSSDDTWRVASSSPPSPVASSPEPLSKKSRIGDGHNED